jgi:hypothetical protein
VRSSEATIYLNLTKKWTKKKNDVNT